MFVYANVLCIVMPCGVHFFSSVRIIDIYLPFQESAVSAAGPRSLNYNYYGF